MIKINYDSGVAHNDIADGLWDAYVARYAVSLMYLEIKAGSIDDFYHETCLLLFFHHFLKIA